MCEALAPGTVCSSNGYCSNETCICTAIGYSSLGDFRFQSGLDCDVYLPAIEGLWACVLIFATFCIFSSCWHLVFLVRKKGWRLGSKQNVFIVQASFATVCPLWVALAGWRLSDVENSTVGTDVGLTYFFILASAGFVVLAAVLLYEFYVTHSVALVDKEQRKMKAKRVLCVMYLISTVFTLLLLWGLYRPEDGDTYLQVRFLLEAVSNFVYSAGSVIAFTPLIQAIDTALISSISLHNQDDLRQLRGNLVRIRKEVASQTFLGGVIKVVFAFWPYLRRKVVYEFPAQAVTWMLLILSISMRLNHSARKSSSASSEAKHLEAGKQIDNYAGHSNGDHPSSNQVVHGSPKIASSSNN
jgi:hypothetical protein